LTLQLTLFDTYLTLFVVLDWVVVVVPPAAFTFELVLNMIGHWWREFWRSAWNWFDALVVVVSILNVSGGVSVTFGRLVTMANWSQLVTTGSMRWWW
jgi:hypothetical protein